MTESCWPQDGTGVQSRRLRSLNFGHFQTLRLVSWNRGEPKSKERDEDHVHITSRAWPLLLVIAAAPVSATQTSCAHAEEATDGLDSWPKVYHAYQQFPECDDGGVAEGYADKIEDLLADQWSDLDVLLKLVKSDPNFEAFVFRHLGEITTLPNAQAITRHAKQSCPRDAHALCARLVAQLEVTGLPE